MLAPMKIDFTAPVGPKKFLRRRREELAAMRFTRIGLEQLGATLGAEISNVDLRRPLDDETLAEIERALLAFKVLFFRDQDLSPAEHAAFGRRFGELEVHPFLPSPEGCPEVVLLAKNEDVSGYENGWHSDVTWRVAPSLGSILRCRECSAVGGDTLFADMAAAYAGLPEMMRARIDGLRAVHDFTITFGRMLSPAELAAKQKKYPAVSHPIVRTHPATGEKVLYGTIEGETSCQVACRTAKVIRDGSITPFVSDMSVFESRVWRGGIDKRRREQCWVNRSVKRP